ncbi:hypothetical protein [Paenibacillus luteus]|uniref:hypothetical protein n=1 Tax=Paenibacillus luteus TaxID=2545753 RepID=UPI001144BA64|nr:hypothetical protein [Paenibacillus luteus]
MQKKSKKLIISLLTVTSVLIGSLGLGADEGGSIFLPSLATAASYSADINTNEVRTYEPLNDSLTISVKLDSEKESETDWNAIFNTSIFLNKDPDNEIEVSYELNQLADDRIQIQSIIQQKINQKGLQINHSQSVPISLNALKIGVYYKLVVTAKGYQNDGTIIANEETVFFHVTAKGIKNGWDIELPSYLPAERINGDKTQILSQPFSNEYGKSQASPGEVEQIQQDTISVNALVNSSGKWSRYTRDGGTTNVRYALVEVLYRDQFYIWRTAATTYTDSSGNWSASYNTPSQSNLWEVRVYSKNPSYGEVQNQSGGLYYSYTQYSDLSTGGSIGTWYVTSGSDQQKAFWSFEDIVRTKETIGSYVNGGIITIVWYPTNTSGSYYTHGGKIYLNQNSPSSKSVTVHEIAHNYMYNIYGSMPSSPSCSPHYMGTASSQGCAWVEGWANFISLYVNFSPIYEYTGGSTDNLENTSSFSSGDSVEGRVAGALWDMYDSTNDGTDIYNFSFSSIYRAMYDSKVNTFSEYWAKWKTLGYSTNAKECIKQNSITYS